MSSTTIQVHLLNSHFAMAFSRATPTRLHQTRFAAAEPYQIFAPAIVLRVFLVPRFPDALPPDRTQSIRLQFPDRGKYRARKASQQPRFPLACISPALRAKPAIP